MLYCHLCCFILTACKITLPTIPVLCLLFWYYAYYVCTMPTMLTICVQWLLQVCLYYAYYACAMLVLCLLGIFIIAVGKSAF